MLVLVNPAALLQHHHTTSFPSAGAQAGASVPLKPRDAGYTPHTHTHTHHTSTHTLQWYTAKADARTVLAQATVHSHCLVCRQPNPVAGAVWARRRTLPYHCCLGTTPLHLLYTHALCRAIGQVRGHDQAITRSLTLLLLLGRAHPTP